MMQCLKCGSEFQAAQQAEAAIHIFVTGDEYTYSYFSCDNCRYYTIKSYCDQFCGEEEVSFLQPVPGEVGEKYMELIRSCPDPRDQTCGCPSHKALFYGTPR